MKNIVVFMIVLLFTVKGFSQIKIEGVVYNKAGNPLKGVTVFVKDHPEYSTRTQALGQFSISSAVKQGMLIVSYVGYDTLTYEFTESIPHIRLVMNSNYREIEEVEVVNTGYQRLPKERATGSFEFINNEQFNTRTGSSVLERIEGLVPGLQFDNRTGSPTINIRGVSTLSTGLMAPLIVLDNFPYHGSIDNLNPDDIESVTILKDAAASSIWGSRAGNGVIVITTKKYKQNVSVDYSSRMTIRDKDNLYADPQMKSADFLEVEKFLFDKGHYNASYNGNARVKKLTVFSPYIDLLYKYKENQASQEELDLFVEHHDQIDWRKELLEIFYRNPIEQQHFVGFSNATAKLSNRVSIGYSTAKGNQVGISNNSINMRALSKLDLSKILTIEGGLTFTGTKSKNSLELMNYSYSPGAGKNTLYPYARFRDDNGNALPMINSFNLEYLQSLQSSKLLDWVFYPADEMDNSSAKRKNQHINAQLSIQAKPFQGLSLNLFYNIDREIGITDALYEKESFLTRGLINRFTQIDGDKVKYIVPMGAIKNSSSAHLNAYNLRGQASYERILGQSHEINAIAGGEFSERENSSATFRVYGFDPELMTSQPVDLVNTYPVYDGLSANARIPDLGGHAQKLQRMVSIYSNIGYTFKEKYGFSFSARKDASNLFGVKTNDKWNPLWSTGASWAVSKEHFLRNVTWINNLRLRVTYGHSGTSGGAANILPLISYTSSVGITTLPRAIVTTLSNPRLRWEDVRTINLGVDYSLLAHKLTGTIEYYDKKSTDLLSNDPMDITTGYTSIVRNVAKLGGQGLDFRISTGYAIGGANARSAVNFSYNQTRVQDFYGTSALGNIIVQDGGKSINPVLDRPLYPIYSYKFAGLDPQNGDPLGIYNKEPSKNYSMMVVDSLQNLDYFGTALPPYFGSYLQEVNWGNFRFNFLISFKFGHYFRKNTINYSSLFSSWRGHSDYENRWQQPGDEFITNIPSMVYPSDTNRDVFYINSSANILKGALVRLQDMGLDYRISPKLFGSKFKATIYFKLNNVGILWTENKQGLDPDYLGIPPSRRYAMGISINL